MASAIRVGSAVSSYPSKYPLTGSENHNHILGSNPTIFRAESLDASSSGTKASPKKYRRRPNQWKRKAQNKTTTKGYKEK